MSMSRILAKEMAKSGGRARMVKVPSNRKPTAESLQKLEREISAQISENEVMRSKSVHKAAQMTLRGFSVISIATSYLLDLE